jgi:nitrite reductase (NADH) large subunit
MTATLEPLSIKPPPERKKGFGPFRRARERALKTVVIIGNGMASHKLCERLKSADHDQKLRLIVFGEEQQPAYDRVHLTSFFEKHSAEPLLLAPKSWYAENRIELHLGDRVTAVDREKRIVRSAGGQETAYDQLVFATGSRPHVPEIPGSDLPGVFVYRTLDDLCAIRDRVPHSKRAAVIGGGLLGVEAAKALRDLGLDTWIVERGTSLLARQLDPQASALLQAHVERLGVKVCTQRATQSIEAPGNDRLLNFTNGECLRVQLVILTVGIRPRDELAAACGLDIGPRGGIKIDDTLRTSDPNIFAIGECASHRGVIYGLAAPAYQMADLLSFQLLGKPGRFEGSDQSTRLKLPGIEVCTLGDFQANGDERLNWTGDVGSRSLVLERGRLVGATSIGEWPEAARVRELTERRARIWRWQRRRFSQTGRLWKTSAEQHVRQWSAQAVVCNCVGVRRGALSQACAEGCITVEQLARKTGASTVCGSCKPLLAQLADAPGGFTSVPGLNLLAAACAITILLTTAMLWVPALPFADTVQSGWRGMDVLWRDSFWKQVSGFTLVGLTLASLLLSARKRIPQFRFGEFGNWRAVHAILGTISLVALVTHTGFRLGHNSNLVLMLDFLALAAMGSLAGVVTVLERRMNPAAAKRMRSLWTGVHIAMAWPLPVFIGLHVAIAYYF